MEDRPMTHEEWEKEKDHLYDLFAAVHTRINDLHSEFSRDVTLLTVFMGVAAIVIPIVIFCLPNG